MKQDVPNPMRKVLFPLLILSMLLFSLFQYSCGGEIVKVSILNNRETFSYQLLTIDPHGSICHEDFECNTPTYEGYCKCSFKDSSQTCYCQTVETRKECLHKGLTTLCDIKEVLRKKYLDKRNIYCLNGTKKGLRECIDFDGQLKWSDCIPLRVEKELCDGLDNNCNGEIDEKWPEKNNACTKGKGQCQKMGFWKCNASHTGLICTAQPGKAKEEICDGLDNDCDGLIDEPEDLQKKAPKCAQQKGACAGTTKFCGGRRGWLPCTAADYYNHNRNYEFIEHTCDGIDNDCDGQIDEDLINPPCPKQEGVCYSSQRKCLGKKGWSRCTTKIYRSHSMHYEPYETKCDSRDNDCDGEVDNIPEICDGKDNNCNGQKDEKGKVLCTRCFTKDNDTLGLWRFNNNLQDETYRYSLKFYNAMDVQEPPKYEKGFCGQALVFKKNYLTGINFANIQPITYTIEAWIKINIHKKGANNTIISGHERASSRISLLVKPTGRIEYSLTINHHQYDISSQTKLKTNTWYYVLATYDYLHKKLQLYIDGKLENESENPLPINQLVLPSGRNNNIILVGTQISCRGNDCEKNNYLDGAIAALKISTKQVDPYDSYVVHFNNLLWTRNIAGPMDWYSAQKYCNKIRIAERNWRLPTVKELESLGIQQTFNGCYWNQKIWGPCVDSPYWFISSTTLSGQDAISVVGYHWVGRGHSSDGSKLAHYWVRCVSDP